MVLTPAHLEVAAHGLTAVLGVWLGLTVLTRSTSPPARVFAFLSLALVACTARTPDQDTPQAPQATSPDAPAPAAKAGVVAPTTPVKKDKDAKILSRPFAWPLEQATLATRGGTSTGAPVTLSPSPSPAWKELAGVPLGIERDRAAIKAMAGEYRTCFDFQETIPLRAGYQLSAPYFSWATERIAVIEDTPTRIVLQHHLARPR